MALSDRVHIGSFLALPVLLAFGCGPPDHGTVVDGPTADVAGKVVDGGEPYVIPEDQYEEGGACLEVGLVSVGDQPYMISAFAKPDGTFLLEGVPVGKYKVMVMHLGAENNSGDHLGGEFDPENTPLTTEVSESSGELVVDLSETD